MKLIIPQLGEGLTSVIVIKKLVSDGERLVKDQCYISIETDKSVVDLEAPAAGVLVEWCCNEGDEIGVGDTVAILEPEQHIEPDADTTGDKKRHQQKDMGDTDIPSAALASPFVPPKTRRYLSDKKIDANIVFEFLNRNIHILLPEHVDEYLSANLEKEVRHKAHAKKSAVYPASQSSHDIFISALAASQGSKKVENKDIASIKSNITETTGIHSRNYIDKNKGESGLQLACSVVVDCLAKVKIDIESIDLLICSTGTADQTTPSLANSILNELCFPDNQRHLGGAFDINAACSGWVYGLQMAYDFLSNTPQANILLVTCETLSELLDPNDSYSSPLFGDAASATLLSNSSHMPRMFKLFRPSIASITDPDCSIRLPFKGVPNDYLSIQGRKVFNMAVKNMALHLKNYCEKNAIALEDLDWVVSHQANERIIQAIENKLDSNNVKFIKNIKHTGNTSSSSIPLTIDQCMASFEQHELIGLVAFGGGFTLGSAFLQRY